LRIYTDTSFLVSLYTLDSNSSVAAQTMQRSSGERYITVLGELEVLNAFQLRVFRKELSAQQVRTSLRDFENDLGKGILLLRPLSEQVFERARELSHQTTARLGTRSADLLHVAAALELHADYLYSFDQQQRKLARTLGLKLNQDKSTG
jgi:predicted nucleic acid-binding protein